MELYVDYSRRDYIEAVREYNSYRPFSWNKTSRRLLARLLDLGIICLCLVVWYFSDNFTVGLLGLGVASVDLWRFVRTYWLISTKDFDRDPRWAEVRRWVITDDGIAIFSNSLNSLIKWNYYHQIIDCPYSYLFFHGKLQEPDWSFLPKRVFDSAREEGLFRETIGRYLPIAMARFNVLNYI
jgi:hypothetical protein